MKAGLSSSLILHAALIGFGLVTISAPTAHDVGDVQAMPVSIVPIEALTELQQGDKTSSVMDKPSPKPTERQDAVLDARNAGENEIDLNDIPRPKPKPTPVETAAAPKVEPAPVVAPEPVEVKQPEPKPEPVAQPEPAPAPAPAPDPVAEAIAAEQPSEESLDFPAELPKPQSRPEPPKPQVAKVEEPKKPEKQPEKPAAQANKAPKPEDLEALTDEVAALLNKQAPAGGGAARSQQQAALGVDKPNSGEKLSQSEMDALRQRLAGCWSIPAGVDDAQLLKVSVRFRLDRSGELEARPEVIRGGGASGAARTAAESAVRAVAKCAPFNLPADKYETWSEVVVNFDPSDMF